MNFTKQLFDLNKLVHGINIYFFWVMYHKLWIFEKDYYLLKV